MDQTLTQILNYFKFQNKLKTVLRNNWTKDGRKESSAEHSWSVAMMVWLLSPLVEKDLDLSLDQSRMIKMALKHDIVEIEAGDVGAWDTDGRIAVQEKELLAIEHLSQEFFSIPNHEIKELWLEHDRLTTTESKLVKACDQLCPLIYRVVYKNDYAGTGMNREKLDSIFLKIVEFSNVTKNLYQQLASEIETNQLFDTTN